MFTPDPRRQNPIRVPQLTYLLSCSSLDSMSRFIDLVETFDLSSITDEAYSKKIDGLLDRFPKYEKDGRFRTVLPQKFPKTADDYISMKLCTKGRYPIFGIYNRRDLNLIGVCVEGIMFALDDCDLHSSLVPDLKLHKLHLGIQYTPLATHEIPNYTKICICSAISTLSLGYTPEKKNEWCEAIVVLTGMTSQAVRFHDMNHQIQRGLNTTTNVNRFALDNLYLAIQSRWNKISKAIRKGEYPYVFSYYMNHGTYSIGSVNRFSAKESVSLINDKDKTKREKFRRRIRKWNGPVGKRKRKRKEERKRSWIMQKIMSMEARKTNQIITMDDKFSERMHGFWYGSVDTFKYEVASVKCLLRPTQMVRANRFLVSTASHLDHLKDVLQVQRNLASILLVVINVWNGGLLAFSRVTHESIADCRRPVFSAAAFYQCAKGHKVSTSRKVLCLDHFGVSNEKTDPENVKWNQGLRPFVQLGCGRIWGALGATCVYPLQVITTRSRVHDQHLNANAGYFRISHVFRTLQHEGLRGFYQGLVPNLLNIVPSAWAATKLKAAL